MERAIKVALLVPVLFFQLSSAEPGAAASLDRWSVAGVRLGDRLEDARARLDQIGRSTGRPATSEVAESIKEAWALDSTEFATVALKTDAEGRVVWITGFVRPGHEVPFKELGALGKAKPNTSALAIWDRPTARPPSRLIARGSGRMAKVVSLISLGGKNAANPAEND